MLVDELGLTADSAQLLTHWLAHLYAPCHRRATDRWGKGLGSRTLKP